MHIALIMAILWFGIWIPEFLVRFSRAYINTVDAFDHIVDYEVVAEFSVDREDIDRDVYFKLVSVKPKFQIYFGILLLMIFSYAYMTNIFADRNIFVVTLSLFMIIPSLGALALRLITVKHDSGVVLIRTFELKARS